MRVRGLEAVISRLRRRADLSDIILSDVDLSGARGVTNDELDEDAKLLHGTTTPNGQKYEEWLKSREEDDG